MYRYSVIVLEKYHKKVTIICSILADLYICYKILIVHFITKNLKNY